MINDTCSVEGCGKPKQAANFCSMHYRRYRLYGDPNHVTRLYGTGKTNHALISVYKDMLRRCNNPNDRAYKSYGGRGIKVCDEWSGKEGFQNFLSDMGERPEGKTKTGKKIYTLDRIDVNGDYCPENCRWATWDEQAKNKRNSVLVTLWGETYTLSSACRIFGLHPANVFSLMGKANKVIKRSPEDALEQGIRNHFLRRVS